MTLADGRLDRMWQLLQVQNERDNELSRSIGLLEGEVKACKQKLGGD